ncbi:DUF4394 domain-containing protein [Flavobacterium sp. ABG]|uniref:DUF4394 domain-containing protein n=1 Tax=Flavobacterium sp. ABG TaxID=1423322 RepID=UPI000649635F|nr:DUF4394 domain-containing protein [Flavobacterium sp. ABG]KLT71679.1 hypothetical protein AB674_01055 [Flavobacterium sp. ABG]
MKDTLLTPRSFLLMGLMSFFGACSNDDDRTPVQQPEPVPMPSTAPPVDFTALSNDNKVFYFNAKDLKMPIRSYTITGLQSGESILSIDYRPATGQLYGLGSTSRLYSINENSGLATPLGAASFSPAIEGTSSSIDFNPTVDRVRLISNNGKNLRLHPELGTVVSTDGNLNGVASTQVDAIAYTNSFSGSTTTQLFDIDYATDKLYLQNPPNDGKLQEVGSLKVDFSGTGGFDIQPDSNLGIAVNNKSNESRLYTINLTNGEAVWVGTFTQQIVEVAFKSKPIAYATSATNSLYRLNPVTGTSNSVALMGMNSSEEVVGLDFRPSNGALYAVTNQNRLLTVNTSNGQVTAVGSVLSPILSGQNFGFDFNPTVDRIRLVSNLGQNLRLNPDTGAVVGTDSFLNPGTPSVSAAAYTNNFAQASSTQLFVIDSGNNNLYLQTPPNNGTLVPVGALGVTTTGMNGFDIGGNSGEAFAILTVSTTQSIYKINLTTGAATKTVDFSPAVTSMTLGLGF